MIFTDRTIIVQKGTSSINDTIILYRGDKDVEIRFTLNEGSPFKFSSGASPNIIEKTEATFGQLVIKAPGALPPIFSEVAPTIGGKIIFTITAEMIDEITEVGNYTFQIRLLDESMNSRATLPEVVNGIEIREPIASDETTNKVGIATVGYALTTAGTTEDAFDEQGNYNKTTWQAGDKITAAKLDKIEAGIDGVNRKVSNVDLSNYVTKDQGNANQITFSDGQTFQAKLDAGTLKGDKGDKGDVGPQGPQGIQGPAGTTTASGVSITDTANNFTATDVEGALQEVGSQIKEKANESDLEIERARIDNLATLNEGSTTGDAELMDARVGANGVIYDNLGSAIRKQIEPLNNMFISKKTINVGKYTWNTTTSFRHYYIAIEFKKDIELSKIEFSALFWNGLNKIVNLDIMDETRNNIIKNASCSINWVDNTTPVDLEFNFNINLNSGVYYLHLSSESSSFSHPNDLSLYEDDYIKIGNYSNSGYKIYTNSSYLGGTEYDDFNSIFQARFTLIEDFPVKELVYKNIEDIKNIREEISTNENYIYVSKNGNDETGDGTKENPYATLYKANESITDNSDDKPYTIIVGKGTYTDLQEKYSGDSTQGTYKGIVCKNNVSYISEDIEHPELCVIEWNGATGFDGNITDKIASDMCAFHITGRNASKKWKTSIKGFKIVGMNLRYCLHIEQNGNSDVTIENCILDWKGTPNIEGSQKKPTVGCGGSYFQNVIFKNCVFLNSQSTAGIQWHDNEYPTSFYGEHNIYQGATFTFKDCYFDGLDLQMRSTSADRKMPFKLKIEDCGGIRKAYFSIGGNATINYWRGHVENSIIEDDRISNATSTTYDDDLAELK